MINLRLSETTSRSQAEGLQDVFFVPVKTGVVPLPPFRDEIVWKGKVGGGAVRGIVVTTDDSLVKC
jgi:hypothetical protein